jgi:hypothetical protein
MNGSAAVAHWLVGAIFVLAAILVLARHPCAGRHPCAPAVRRPVCRSAHPAARHARGRAAGAGGRANAATTKRSRRTYRLTSAGQKMLAAEKGEWDTFRSVMESVLRPGGATS